MNTASKREPKELVDNRRWMAYAAASAAGALVCQGAEADIIHVTVNQMFNGSGGAATATVTATFSVGNNSSASLFFSHYGTPSSGGAAFFDAKGAGAGVAGFNANAYAYALNLAPGQNVSTAGEFLSGGGSMAFFSSASGSQSQFLDPGIGFLGFRFNNLTGEQYGWARVDMSGADINSFTVVDYAYTDEGEGIRAGQTTIPEPGSLGLLAAGAAGLAIARRRRRKKSDS